MRALSLFSGGGGLDLAAEWAGIHTVAMCEREPYPRAVLRKHWPDVPIYDDVCSLTASRLKEDGIIGPSGTIDVIHGGFPCQPFSHAGKRGGTEDDRYLWPEMFRIISEIRPTWVVAENVDGLLSMEQSDSQVVMEDETTLCEEAEMVLETIRGDFANEGYETITIVLPAAGVGAPHRRYRILIVGHTERGGCGRESWGRSGSQSANGHFKHEEGSMANASGSERERSGESREWWGGPTDHGSRANRVMDNTPGKRCGEAREHRSDGTKEWTPGSGQALADSGSIRCFHGCNEEQPAKRGQQAQCNFGAGRQDVADSSSSRRQECNTSTEPDQSRYSARGDDPGRTRGATQSGMGGMLDGLSDWMDRYRPRNIRLRSNGGIEVLWPAAMGQPQYSWEPPRVASGIKNRQGRLKLLGNAVSPAQGYPVFAFIRKIHDERS
ncbi:DNA cytosine methyltransferase [Paenibacillus sp. FJAT-26967]|uniref:DNA cytosine methyltransferase n=1 Tax=Paenibacillus sp. FJAT-26967 TaxID=1729690 RepID=UPI000A06A668|nr:DNA cytosine methyltransferase [Paenibacillus sp. FJAT-26967]